MWWHGSAGLIERSELESLSAVATHDVFGFFFSFEPRSGFKERADLVGITSILWVENPILTIVRDNTHCLRSPDPAVEEILSGSYLAGAVNNVVAILGNPPVWDVGITIDQRGLSQISNYLRRGGTRPAGKWLAPPSRYRATG